jgi:hypothetical protein
MVPHVVGNPDAIIENGNALRIIEESRLLFAAIGVTREAATGSCISSSAKQCSKFNLTALFFHNHPLLLLSTPLKEPDSNEIIFSQSLAMRIKYTNQFLQYIFTRSESVRTFSRNIRWSETLTAISSTC